MNTKCSATTSTSRPCSALTASGRHCRAWAVSGSDPPLCSAHAGRDKGAGAPFGNQNRLEHGFYSRYFTLQELADLLDTADIPALVAEIFPPPRSPSAASSPISKKTTAGTSRLMSSRLSSPSSSSAPPPSAVSSATSKPSSTTSKTSPKKPSPRPWTTWANAGV